MVDTWKRVIEIIGLEKSELLRYEFAGETFRIPKKLPKYIVVPSVKAFLKDHTYGQCADRYGLSECTVRRYEKWKVEDGVITSISGRKYDCRPI